LGGTSDDLARLVPREQWLALAANDWCGVVVEQLLRRELAESLQLLAGSCSRLGEDVVLHLHLDRGLGGEVLAPVGCSGVPPFEATMTNSSPGCW
jgi:hypothetical protein